MAGTAVLYRGAMRVCVVRYAVTIIHPSPRVPRIDVPRRPRIREQFIAEAVIRFDASNAGQLATLWSAHDLDLTVSDGRRFACLLFRSVTADNTMWECGLNPYREGATEP
jgi:hypothetical protein